MESSIRNTAILAALLVLVQACSLDRFREEEPVRYDRTLSLTIDDPQTKAFINPDGAVKTVTWTTDDVFSIYRVSDGTCHEVNPVSVNEDGSKVVLPLPFDDAQMDVIVAFGGVSYSSADSLIYASAPIKQKLCTGGYDANALPLATYITTVGTSSNSDLTLHPLTALVEMDLTELPNSSSEKVRSISVTTDVAKGTRGYNIAANKYMLTVTRDAFVRGTTLMDLYEGGDYGQYIELCSDELLTYSDRLPVYFLAAHMSQGDEVNTYIKSLTVAVTTDKSVISKTFDTSEAMLRTTCGRASKFELNMSNAKVEARKGFSVQWSEGYITYDEKTKGYGFAKPEDHGLYFKSGSICGLDLFTSVPEDERYAVSRYLVAYEYDTIADTLVVTPYYNTPWSEGSKDLKAYKVDANGDVVPFHIDSYDDINDFATYEHPEYSYDQDPCKYVKDGYSWRMPTTAEFQEYIDVVMESISNWKVYSRGCDYIDNVDGRPHILSATDCNGQTVAFATTGQVSHKNSVSTSKYNLGVQTYYVYVMSTSSVYVHTPVREKKMSSKNEGYTNTMMFNIGTLSSLRNTSEQSPKLISTLATYPTTQGAAMVRCVRAK